MGWISLKKGMHRFLPGLTVQPVDRVALTLRMLTAGAKVCDIGAGGRRITPAVFTIDGHVSENVDLVCDIHSVPLPDESFDCVFCTGTLEHVKDPARALSEIYRLLKKGGLAHIEVPFIQAYHADPDDYWRWTHQGLKLFCSNSGFTEVASGSHIGPSSALNWVMNEYIVCLLGNGIAGSAAASIARLMPLKYLDYLLTGKSSAVRIASGFYFVGRK